MRYAALLRGINVGGANKVPMPELKAAFEASGMTEVVTYINSGNVVFEAGGLGRECLRELIEGAVAERFGDGIGVLLRDAGEIGSIVSALPAEWRNDQSMRCDVLFLFEDVDSPEILGWLDFRPQIEDVLYVPGAVIWRIDRANATRSRLPRIVGTPLYKRMTVRNCNTARKLLELIGR